jgi:hypothetical protein
MRFIWIFLAGAMLPSCASQPKNTYPVPREVAFERLRDGDVVDFRNAWQCGMLLHFNTIATPNEQVRWIVKSGGRQVAEFSARLVAVDSETTRIDIQIPTAPDGGEIYDGTKEYEHPAFYQPLRPAIEEFVAARIEQRAFVKKGLPGSDHNGYCGMTKESLLSGTPYSIEDEWGMDTRQSKQHRANQQASEGNSEPNEPDSGQPIDGTRGEN